VPGVRGEAAMALGRLKTSTAIERLIDMLEEDTPVVRKKVVPALGSIGDTRAVEPLIRALEDPVPEVRKNTVQALGKIKDYRIMDSLIKALRDKAGTVRNEAARTLGKVGDARAVKPLLKLTLKGIFRNFLKKKAKEAMDKLSTRLVRDETGFVCDRCFLRYKSQTAAFLNIYTFRTNYVTYSSCPKCQSDTYYLIGVEKIILLLDHGFKDIFVHEGTVVKVNWLINKGLIDYDEVHIKDADDFEVEELVLKLRNDMDDERRERLRETPFYLTPGLDLSPAKMNLLKDNFLVKMIE
jgi:hypothetical protein